MKTEMKTPMSAFSLGSGESTPSGDASDIITELLSRIAVLESQSVIPSSSEGTVGDVLTLGAARPEWDTGTPDGVAQGDIIYWDTTAPASWKVLTNPSTAGKVLQSTVASPGLKFDYLAWR